MLLDKSCAATAKRWQGLGKDRKGRHFKLMTVCSGLGQAEKRRCMFDD